MKLKDIPEHLKNANIRPTRKKVAIIEELIISDEPLDAYQLYRQVNSRKSVDLATVYRTLAVLRETNLVHEINDVSGISFYEILKNNSNSHPHFKCSSCGRYFCLPDIDEERKKILIEMAKGFRTSTISIVMSGECPDCK